MASHDQLTGAIVFDMELEPNRCYQALRSRDRRFDGRFFVAVRTTGIYCRPICPAPAPKQENVQFFACAAAAEAAGYRACLRCRPETSPGTPAWAGTSAVVSRALRLIRQGALDEHGIAGLAARLGIGARQLRRLFAKHLGTSPLAIARAQRLHLARALIDDTDLAVTKIAFAAGFNSVRQFNHAVRGTFGDSPRGLRRRRRRSASLGGGESLVVRLPYRPPFDWAAMVRFLAPRATPGVEAVTAERYARTIEIDGAAGTLEVAPVPGESCLMLRARLPEGADVLPLVERARRIFDLTADPLQIGEHLKGHGALGALVTAAPGLRVPGAWDPFELAIRAILGQQVTVRGATTLTGRLVQALGRPVAAEGGLTHLFPRPEVLADGDLSAVGIPRARAASIRALARAVADGTLALDASRGLDDAVARLCAVPGVGPWTAQYIAMRGLGEPDAFPVGDLGLRQALGNGAGPLTAAAVERLAEAWRPWRAYAAMHLWTSLAAKEDR